MNMNTTSTNAESTGRNSIGAKMAVGITGCSAGILPAVGASSGGRHFRAGRRKPGTRNRRCGRTLFAAAVSLAVAGTLALPPAARAGGGPATLTWDPSGNHTASDGGGNWDTSTRNWATGSSDVAWVNGDVASIGAGGGSPETVTINTTGITASGLTFNAMGSGGYYTIAGNATDNLTLSNGGNNVDIVMNANATISTPFSVNSNLLVSGNKTLTITGDSTFGSGIGVTIGTGSASNIPTIAALSHGGGGGPAFITFNGGTLISEDLGGGGGNVVTSLGGSGIINTFDADANSSSDLQSQINQAGAATFVLRDGTISLTADNSSSFNNGTLQIGNGSLATDVLFGYQVGGANNNNLPASGVTIALDNGSLTQASSNGPNGETVDNAANTINNPVTLSGSNNFIDATGGTIILSGAITNTGTSTLTLEDGTIALTGTNNVLFNTGTLQIGTGSPPWGIVGFSAATNLPGSGAGITLDVGQLDYTGGSAVTVANAISFGGPNGNFIYADNPAVTLTFSGPIIGTGGGFDLSSGTFVLGSTSNSADFTGGGLGIGDGSDPTTVDFGAATNLPGSGAGITLEVGTLAYTGGGQETVFNAITDTAGTNNVIDAGGGASQLTLSGAITNTAGTLTLWNGLFVLGSTSNVTDFTGGTLQIGNGEGGSVAVFTSASNLPASAVGITLDQGTLQYMAPSLTVSNNLTLSGNGVINVFGFGDPSSGETYNGNITGAGNLTVADSVGGGELYLTGNNSAFTGNTTIQNGVEVGFSTATAFGSGTVSMGTGGGALEYNNSLTVNNNLVLNNNGDIDLHGHTSTWAGVISGPGGLMVHDYFGGDTLTLTAANTYTGGTTVGIGNAVTVTLAPGASLANSNITIHANATLNGSGTLNYHIVNDTADLITDNGTLDITNLNLNLVTSGTQTLNQYVVANYSGGSLTGTKFASVNNLPNGWSVNYGGINPNEIILVAFAPTTLTWDPGLTKTGSDGLGNWDTSAANWATGSADTTWANGDTASIGAGGTGNTITIDVAGTSANGITFNALASGQYTIASGGTGDDLTLGGAVTLNNNATISAPLVGSNDVTITGAHTLTLSGDNSGFSGNSTIENGATVNFTTSTALGTGGGITMGTGGGELQYGAASLNVANDLTLTGNGTIDVNGFGGANAETYSGDIGGGGALTLTDSVGGGILNLFGNDSGFSGNTTVQNGVQVNFSTSLAFGTGGSINIGGGAGAGGTIAPSTTGLTLANDIVLYDAPVSGTPDVYNTKGVTSTLTGVISTAGETSGGLIITGGGTVNLNGTNTYSGGTLIEDTTVGFNNNSGFGSGTITIGALDPITGTIQYTAGKLTIANPLTLNGNGTIDANGFGGANAETYSGAISGGGALTIASTIPGGELILSGENSYVGGTNIDTGATAVVDSATALGAGNVNLIGATLENINALYSNNTSGMAINVGGNYAMDSRSTIVLTISGRPDTGQYDTLSVTGTATLAGTLFITFNQGFVPTALDKYTVVTASAVTGQFASVKATNQPVVFSQTVSSTRDVIEILPILNQLTALAGQSMVNIGVQNDVFESESVYGEIADLFAGSGGFNAAGLSLLDTPNADPFTAALNSAMQSVGRQAQNSVSELDVFNSVPSQGGAVPVPGSEAPRNTLSGFATGEVIVANGLPGTTTGGSAHLTTGGVITGVDYNMASHLVLGALFAYGYSGASLDSLGSRLRTNIYSPGLFLGVRKSHFYLDTLASYTYNAYRLNRNITVPSAATADSSPYGNQFAVDSMLGYNFHVARGLKLGPAAGLDYTHLNVSGYTETGGGAGDLAVSPVSFDSLRSLIGGRLNYAWRLRPTASAVNFTANAFWQHEYRNLSRGLIAQFTGLGGSSFASNTPSEGHDSALAGAGVSGNLASNVTLFVNYEAQIGPSHELAQSVMAGVAIALR